MEKQNTLNECAMKQILSSLITSQHFTGRCIYRSLSALSHRYTNVYTCVYGSGHETASVLLPGFAIN